MKRSTIVFLVPTILIILIGNVISEIGNETDGCSMINDAIKTRINELKISYKLTFT